MRPHKDVINKMLEEIKLEFLGSYAKFPGFNSPHEGYAVILEEVDELWDEIKKNPHKRRGSKMYAETRQVAAMALKLMSYLWTYND